jgi:2'-5' RNA ligase
MRLFTALDISDDARAALTELLDQLAQGIPFHWSPLENLHITTKFIGGWPVEKYESLRHVLAGVASGGPLEIAIRGLGWYPNPHNPRVLFAGIEAGPALQDLHQRTDAACAAIGIPAETKTFNPHLTLARIKSPNGLQMARQRIAQLPSTEFGRFKVDTFQLYESSPGPGGSQYSKLEEFSLL